MSAATDFMEISLDEADAKRLLAGISLPPQPATLMEVRKEQTSDDPNLARIAEVIARDMSVSAGVLKTVNSPFFGVRRTIESIHQAVTMLGLQNVVNIVTSLSLRDAMTADYPAMDRFFDTASDTAMVAAALAKEFRVIPADKAYTLGLFHDCGMPLLMLKFKNYKDILRIANASTEKSLTEVEDQHLSTNHAVVGYYISRNWGLPPDIGQAIINHHRVGEILVARELGKLEDDDGLAAMVGLLTMAEHISYEYRGRKDQHEWTNNAERILALFDLTEAEYASLKEDMFDKLAD